MRCWRLLVICGWGLLSDASHGNQFHEFITKIEQKDPIHWVKDKEKFTKLAQALRLKNATLAAHISAYANYRPWDMKVNQREIISHLRLGANELGPSSPYVKKDQKASAGMAKKAAMTDEIKLDDYLRYMSMGRKKEEKKVPLVLPKDENTLEKGAFDMGEIEENDGADTEKN